MTPYVAESERLWLQELNVEDHLDGYFKLNSDPQAMFWSTKKIHANREETLRVMQENVPTTDQPWKKTWAIMLRPDKSSDITGQKPSMLGVIGTPRKSEIGYKTLPEYWGKGYMSEALALFLSFWWNDKGYKTPPQNRRAWADKIENDEHSVLNAYTDRENIASQRVLERAGFQKGRLFEKFYTRGINIATGTRGDLQNFWLQRPGSLPVENGDLPGMKAPLVPKLEKEDVDSIKSILQQDGVSRKNLAI